MELHDGLVVALAVCTDGTERGLDLAELARERGRFVGRASASSRIADRGSEREHVVELGVLLRENAPDRDRDLSAGVCDRDVVVHDDGRRWDKRRVDGKRSGG